MIKLTLEDNTILEFIEEQELGKGVAGEFYTHFLNNSTVGLEQKKRYMATVTSDQVLDKRGWQYPSGNLYEYRVKSIKTTFIPLTRVKSLEVIDESSK